MRFTSFLVVLLLAVFAAAASASAVREGKVHALRQRGQAAAAAKTARKRRARRARRARRSRSDPNDMGVEMADEDALNSLSAEEEEQQQQQDSEDSAVAMREEADAAEHGGETDGAIEEKLEKAGEKSWVVPHMKPLGYFKKAAGIEPNMTKYENTFEPTMIPRGGFALRAKKPEEPKEDEIPQYQPPTVTHGKLQELKEQERREEEAEIRGTDVMDGEQLKASQVGPACQLMEQTLAMGRHVRAEEAAAKDGATRQGLVQLIKLMCPVLKYEYSFLMRCKSCEKMAARIAKLYDPKFDHKMFPGLQHPDRCDKDKWAIRNFAIEAAMTDPNLFFGVDFCNQDAAVEEDAQEGDAAEGDADAGADEAEGDVDAAEEEAQAEEEVGSSEEEDTAADAMLAADDE